jgi:phage terminase large subunit
MADFRKYTGLVYKEFQREVHVIEPFDIPSNCQLYRSIDFGSTNPTACLWIAVDGDENWYIYQEHYETGQTIDYHSGVINSKSSGKSIIATYGDPSGAQWISEFAQRGIYITPANKETGTNFNSWVRFGIEKVAEKLKVIPGHVVPILSQSGKETGAGLFIFSTCVNTIKEFETYRWKEKSVTQAQDLNEPDVPEKANDHAMDALRYFAVSYQKHEPINPNDLPQYKPSDKVIGI